MIESPDNALPGIDRSTATPLHRQVYERFRTAIEHGVLRPGDRVASARSLASELGVARGTVEAAYSQLAGEGYFSAQGQAGTVVSPSLPVQRPVRTGSRPVADAPALAGPAAPPPLQLGIPALDAFPRKLWARLMARRARATPSSLARLRAEATRSPGRSTPGSMAVRKRSKTWRCSGVAVERSMPGRALSGDSIMAQSF